MEFVKEGPKSLPFKWLCESVCMHDVEKKRRRRQTSYNIARLLLMALIEPWQNFTPFFGAVAFCTTNIDNFRRKPERFPKKSKIQTISKIKTMPKKKMTQKRKTTKKMKTTPKMKMSP